jgi:gamma-tubulin complex component 2
MHQAKQKIVSICPNPDEFLQKYEELKSKNLRDLDPLVYFLADINDKPEVNNWLK